MNGLASGGYTVTGLLLAVAFVLSAFQTVRLCREVSGRQAPAPVLLLDGALLLHLVEVCLVMRCVEAQTTLLALPGGVAFAVEGFMWVNALGAGLALFCAVRYRDARELLVAAALGAMLPPALSACGGLAAAVCGIDCAVMGARIAHPYLSGARWSGAGVSSASPAEVLNQLPHGVLCAQTDGRIVLLNDPMRRVLTALGLKTDLSDARDIFAVLADGFDRANGTGDARAALDARRSQDDGEPQLIAAPQCTVRLDDGRMFQIAVDDGHRAASGLRFAFAYDVSSEMRVNQQLARANERLEQQNRELSRLLQSILRAADGEADLQMRGRVHDVVGQRLSILHRSLEDGRIDDAAIAQMKPLLNDLLDDLRPGAEADSAAELSAVVDAFGLAGVECEVTGRLASESGAARVQVRVVREALTNALRHGHAHRVRICLGCSEEGPSARCRWFVQVENDGEPASGSVHEGSGLTGLRRAVEGRGGRFSVEGQPHFTVRAELPATQREGSREGSVRG